MSVDQKQRNNNENINNAFLARVIDKMKVRTDIFGEKEGNLIGENQVKLADLEKDYKTNLFSSESVDPSYNPAFIDNLNSIDSNTDNDTYKEVVGKIKKHVAYLKNRYEGNDNNFFFYAVDKLFNEYNNEGDDEFVEKVNLIYFLITSYIIESHHETTNATKINIMDRKPYAELLRDFVHKLEYIKGIGEVDDKSAEEYKWVVDDENNEGPEGQSTEELTGEQQSVKGISEGQPEEEQASEESTEEQQSAEGSDGQSTEELTRATGGGKKKKKSAKSKKSGTKKVKKIRKKKNGK